VKERALTPAAPAPLPEQPAPLEELLVRQWTGFAYTIAGDYFLPGGDLDDIRQEALIGLVNGLRAFDPALGVPLKGFLRLTITRQVLTAVKQARRLKRRQITEALRVIELDDETVDAVDAFSDPLTDCHRSLIARLTLDEVKAATWAMSDLEAKSLIGVAIGVPYLEIDCDAKKVDNALQRARRKLREAA